MSLAMPGLPGRRRDFHRHKVLKPRRCQRAIVSGWMTAIRTQLPPPRPDVPIPGAGLGRRLTDMLEWCRESVASGAWEQHHRSERRMDEVPVDYARFYFANAADAEAFRRRWQSSLPSGDVRCWQRINVTSRSIDDQARASVGSSDKNLSTPTTRARRHQSHRTHNLCQQNPLCGDDGATGRAPREALGAGEPDPPN